MFDRAALSVPPVAELRSGAMLDILDPDPSMITIEDIAAGLAKNCRFAGQCHGFYSIAEHSVLASYLVPPEFAFEALMHDAPEFILGDMITPIKQLLPDYRAIEARMTAAIAQAFDLPATMSPQVKHADLQMLAAEKWEVKKSRARWPVLVGVNVPFVRFAFLSADDAERVFLDRFAYLDGWRCAQ